MQEKEISALAYQADMSVQTVTRLMVTKKNGGPEANLTIIWKTDWIWHFPQITLKINGV